MTPEEKAQIDGMSYADMLRRVRFDPLGSLFFNSFSVAGKYAWARWTQLCQDTPHEERVAASKSIGWDKL